MVGAEECPAGWVNAQTKGCFAFLLEDTQLSWVEASIACEQVLQKFKRISKNTQIQEASARTQNIPKACVHALYDLFPQAGGYLAEPKHIDQMEFLNALAGLQADFTGIKYDFSKRSTE